LRTANVHRFGQPDATMLRGAPTTDQLQTNGSGYSLIHLTGHPPADLITVAAGSSTSATSD
jgi:hypothetical protein